jgi:hypothetical protein
MKRQEQDQEYGCNPLQQPQQYASPQAADPFFYPPANDGNAKKITHAPAAMAMIMLIQKTVL